MSHHLEGKSNLNDVVHCLMIWDDRKGCPRGGVVCCGTRNGMCKVRRVIPAICGDCVSVSKARAAGGDTRSVCRNGGIGQVGSAVSVTSSGETSTPISD